VRAVAVAVAVLALAACGAKEQAAPLDLPRTP
jgi:predicted small lipoprotein YifL